MSAEITLANRTDSKETEVRGLAFAVGFFFSFRLCIVLLSVHLLGVEASTGTAISVGLDLVLFGLVCFGVAADTTRTIRSLLQSRPALWVLAFLAFSGLSLVWSETASLPTSLAYWLGLVIDVANVAIILQSGTGINESYSLMKGFIWSTFCLALVAWMMPAAPDLRLGDEQFFNTNQIGNLCAFAIFFAQFLTRRKQGEWKLARFFLVITLIRSLSKTTLVAFAVSQGLLLILDRSTSRRAKMLLIISAFFLLIVFWGLFEAYYGVYTSAGNQAETLTGRIVIWVYVLNAVGDHPWTLWIGHGFDSWWKVVPPFGGELFEARHAENEVLQQLYAYGAAGIVLLAGLYGSLYRQLRKLERSPTRILLICFLIFIVVRGLAESDAFDLLLPSWSILLISLLAEWESAHGQDPAVVTCQAAHPVSGLS